MSALKSLKRFDSNSSTTTNRSRFSQQSSYKKEQKQYAKTFLNNLTFKQILKNKEEIMQKQYELRYNLQNQIELESKLQQLQENYEQFINMIQELANNIQNKERSRNLVVGATAFLGGIFSFLTFGISAIVGGAAAYGAKVAFDNQLNKLRREKSNYYDRMQEAASLIREVKNKLYTLYQNQNNLDYEIRNLRAYETRLLKQIIH